MYKRTRTQRLLLPVLSGALLALVLFALPVEAQRSIELLETLPGGTDCIGFAGGPACTSVANPGNHPLGVLNAYLRPMIPYVVGVSAGLAVLMIVLGGLQIMISGGVQNAKWGRDHIFAALIGLMILIFSSTILYFLNASFFRQA